MFYNNCIQQSSNIQCLLAVVGALYDELREKEDLGVVTVVLDSEVGVDAHIHFGNFRGLSFVLSNLGSF